MLMTSPRPGAAGALFALLVLINGAARAETAPAAPPALGVVVASGIVAEGDKDSSLIWITLGGSDLRFETPTEAVQNPDGLFAAAKQSADKRLRLTITYDPDSGFMDPATGKATFAIRQVRLGDKTIAGAGADADLRRTPASPAEAALARALGLSEEGDPKAVRVDLTTALADPDLPTAWRISALKTRASVDEANAEGDLPAGPDRDRLLLSALEDNRAWVKLAPDDADAALGVAANLEELGAYDDALGAYRAMRAKWPDEDYRSAIRIGAVFRTRGQYDRALAELDDLVARKGAQSGMKFHYNRGRTLSKLGRHLDAVKEFDAGLKDQPDYAWAKAYRACDLAAVGRLDEALADQTSAAAILARWAGEQRPTLTMARGIRQVAEVADQLRQAKSAKPPAKPIVGCDIYFDDFEKTRDRSPMLPSP